MPAATANSEKTQDGEMHSCVTIHMYLFNACTCELLTD